MVVKKDDLTSDDVRAFIKKLNITKVKTSAVSGSDDPSKETLKTKKRKLQATVEAKGNKTELNGAVLKAKRPKSRNSEYWNDTKQGSQSRILLKNYETWYSILSAEFDTKCERGNKMLSEQKLIEIESYIEKIFQTEVDLFNSWKTDWKNDLLTSGTRKDQITAKSSLIESAAIHQLANLDSLIDLVRKGKLRKGVAESNGKGSVQNDHSSREQILTAIGALEQLWIKSLLPDRNLIPFERRPLVDVNSLAQNDPIARNKILVIWYFESLLEQRFRTFVINLNFCLHDTVEKIRERAIKCILILLSNKPHLDKVEDEKMNILRLLIDKTGDPNRTVASYASHCAGSLLIRHSPLKEPMIIEAENLLFRLTSSKNSQQSSSKASSSNAMHYCVCFLNQIVLSKDEHRIAERLMFVYMSLFRVISNKFDLFSEKSEEKGAKNGNPGTGQQEMRILTNVLTGIHRAMPYCKADQNEQLLKQIHLFYKIVHTKKMNTSIQALMILLEMARSEPTQNDRFYTAFYRKLLEPGLPQSHNLSLLFNLIFKTMKRDKRGVRQYAFKKRLLQLGLSSSPPFTCALLCLLSQFVEKPKQVESKVLKKKKSKSKVRFSGVQNDTIREQTKRQLEDSDDEEFFHDVDENGVERNTGTVMTAETELSKPQSDTLSVTSEFSHGGDLLFGQSYKPRCVNPSFSGADSCPLWDFTLLSNHYHPSVCKFSEQVNNGTVVEYNGDPLIDFTSSKFIERFSGKKLKVTEGKKAASPMAPKTKQFMPGVKKLLTASQGPDLSYIDTYAKLCKELKQNSKIKDLNNVKKGGNEKDFAGIEEVDSDDEDFDQFLDALDEEQFKAASGGVQIEDVASDDDYNNQDDGILEYSDGEAEMFDNENDDDDDEFEESAALEDSDFENAQSDDDLFL